MACMKTQSRTQYLIPGLYHNSCFRPKLESNGQITVKIVLYGGTVLYNLTVILADRNLDCTVQGNYGP